MTGQTVAVRHTAQDAQALLRAAGIHRRERRLVEALLRRMARLEAALRCNPTPGPQRDRLWQEVRRLRQAVARARAAFARRPLAAGIDAV